MFLTFFGVMIILLWAYILFAREWLDTHLQGTKYAYWHEQIEDKLWSSSRTILTGLALKLGGVLVAVHELLVAQGFDETSIFYQVQELIPEKYRPYAPVLFGLFLIIVGQVMTYLRRQTTTPVQE
jgi:hypothetical protein